MDRNFLCLIPIYKINDNWQGVSVTSIDDENFNIHTNEGDHIFRDEDIKPDKDGKGFRCKKYLLRI